MRIFLASQVMFLILTGFIFEPRTLASEPIVVGSKIFTESYILAEIAAQIVEASSRGPVKRRLGMGSTGMLFESLKTGAIDIYPDYSGTVAETILKKPELKSINEIKLELEHIGVTLSPPLGFNNTYALAVKENFAVKNHLSTISDLVPLSSQIRAAFSYEFMERQDGYNGLTDRYKIRLEPRKVKRMEHSLVYRAINDMAVDLIEVYSTDANIKRYGLRLLKDDKNYFPNYQAVWVVRKAFVENHPAEWQALLKYSGSLDEEKMAFLNAEADIQKLSFEKIASRWLGLKVSVAPTHFDQLFERTREHLWLVSVALLFSILIGVPMGILSARFQVAGQIILLSSALVQTIPALALLCFLIPFFGVGTKPALVALCLYSLLPVVVNTFTGVRSVEAKHVENAKAFGLTPAQILRRVVLPMASPTILAGIKTAAIVSVGTATLAALVGAGGYGALIISGLSLNDIPMILTGAVPAALMALMVHISFMVIETLVVSKGLRERR